MKLAENDDNNKDAMLTVVPVHQALCPQLQLTICDSVSVLMCSFKPRKLKQTKKH